MGKGLDLKKLRIDKNSETVSSEEALKDVEPYFTEEEINEAWKKAIQEGDNN